ncbi:MAG TPA: tetratricopeptide repeat protein [Thermoanaerobaculia bacterium]|nr:tetratricopeptide repeat protein [Thermoanaerobaculia bacterium]
MPAAPSVPGGTSQKAQAAYQFALAKELQAEGAFLEANAALQKATELEPDAPYLLAEYAENLIQLAELSRAPSTRDAYLQQARKQIDRARQLAPDNLDVIRTAGGVYLGLSVQDPTAVATAQELLEQVRKRDPLDARTIVALGRLYLDSRQPDKAVEVFRELVSNVPQQRAGYAFLVESLLQARRDREAEPVLQEILGFDPGSLEARLTLADLQGQRGDHKAAAATLRAAPEAVRNEPRLRRQLAWSLYLDGDLEASLAEVQPLLSQPDAAQDRALNLLTGLIYTAEGRNAEALERLQKARQGQPTDIALALTVTRVLQREGRTAEAAKLLHDLADALVQEKKEGPAQEIRLEAAQLYLEAKEWDAAQAALAPLLAATDPAVRNQARADQAELLVGRQRYDEALAAIGTDNLTPQLASKRAEILLRAGREAEARQQIQTLTTGGRPEAIVAAAQAYHRVNRYTDSIPLLRTLVDRQTGLVPARFLLGAAYERTGQAAEAAEQFRRIIEIDPDYHAALNYLGYMYAERGEKLDESLSLVRRALALDPDNGSYVDSLGWAYFKLGQHEQARRQLERAVRLEPRDGTVHEHLGEVYEALGKPEQARQAYQRALELGEKEGEQADVVERLRRKLDGLQPTAPR